MSAVELLASKERKREKIGKPRPVISLWDRPGDLYWVYPSALSQYVYAIHVAGSTMWRAATRTEHLVPHSGPCSLVSY